MVKLQVTFIFEASTNVYETSVVPISNSSPGLWVDSSNSTCPELSVAVGSSQHIWIAGVPSSMVL